MDGAVDPMRFDLPGSIEVVWIDDVRYLRRFPEVWVRGILHLACLCDRQALDNLEGLHGHGLTQGARVQIKIQDRYWITWACE